MLKLIIYILFSLSLSLSLSFEAGAQTACPVGVAAVRNGFGIEYAYHHCAADCGIVPPGRVGAIHAVLGLRFAGQGSGVLLIA